MGTSPQNCKLPVRAGTYLRSLLNTCISLVRVAKARGPAKMIVVRAAHRRAATGARCSREGGMVTILSASLAYLTGLKRALPVLLCPLFLAGATTSAWAADAARPRRVLMVHSFGSSAPPFTTHSTAF